MKNLVLYTAARIALFTAAYGLIWLVFGRWLTWDSVSGLWTAFVALVISSLLALTTLGGLRERLAADVAERATRAKAAYDARARREDD